MLAAYAYDNVGRRTSVTFGNGSVQSFAYDAASRLDTLTNNLGGSATTHDLVQAFTYNPASQIGSVTRSNDAYAWQAHYNVDRSYVADGLNRIMNIGSTAFAYDARGNLTSDGTNSFVYSPENLMTDGPGGAKLKYDALGRLLNIHSTTTPILGFAYDGIDRIAEYQTTSSITARYVHGPGIDNPIVWYDGSAISSTTRRFLMADERGSVVSITDSAGATINLNAYDEYGIPAPGNVGKFGYTGQLWLPEIGMWYYKARIYSPTLGRFMQTDPIGYADGMNWYNYVGSDPVNFGDTSGLVSDGFFEQKGFWVCQDTPRDCEIIREFLNALRKIVDQLRGEERKKAEAILKAYGKEGDPGVVVRLDKEDSRALARTGATGKGTGTVVFYENNIVRAGKNLSRFRGAGSFDTSTRIGIVFFGVLLHEGKHLLDGITSITTPSQLISYETEAYRYQAMSDRLFGVGTWAADNPVGAARRNCAAQPGFGPIKCGLGK